MRVVENCLFRLFTLWVLLGSTSSLLCVTGFVPPSSSLVSEKQQQQQHLRNQSFKNWNRKNVDDDVVAVKTLALGYRNTQVNLGMEVLEGAVVVFAGFAGWLYIDGADDRERKRRRQEEEERYATWQAEREKSAYVEPKEYWNVEELAQYDGTQDEENGPILFAADGIVFNVYKGRNFYGPGGEYHIFAGRDATRLLARTKVEEETPEEAAKPLTMAERAALAGWMFTFKGKYDVVGKLEGFDPSTTSMKM